MGRGAGEAAGSGARAGVDAVHGRPARRRSATASTTTTALGALPGLEQVDRLALQLAHLDARRPPLAQRAAPPAARRRRRRAGGCRCRSTEAPSGASLALDLELAGSGSRRRCRGRSCGSPARSGGAARRRAAPCVAATNSRRSSSIERWFCEVGGTILASMIVPVVVDLVAVVEQAARRLADAVADRRRAARARPPARPAARRRRSGAAPRRRRRGSRPRARRCCGTGCGSPSPRPASARRLGGQRREALAVELEARQRPGQVGAALAQPRVQRVRVRDLLLLEGRRRTRRRRCRAPVGRRSGRGRSGTRPGSERSADQLVVALELGEVEAGGPAHRLQRLLAAALQLARAAARSSRRSGAR